MEKLTVSPVVDAVNIWLMVVETGVYVVATWYMVAFFWMMKNCRALHIYLQSLFLNYCAGTVVSIVIKMLYNADKVWPYLGELQPYFFILELGFLDYYFANTLVMVLVLYASTMKANTFEKSFNKTTCVGIILMPWILTVVNGTAVKIMLTINPALCGLLAKLVGIAVTVVIFVMLYINEKKFTKAAYTASLSHRYQLAENIRTIRMLACSSVIGTVCFVPIVVVTLLAFMKFRYSNVTVFLVLTNVIDIFTALHKLFVFMSWLYMPRIVKCYQSRKIRRQPQLRDADNYFAQFNNQWI